MSKSPENPTVFSDVLLYEQFAAANDVARQGMAKFGLGELALARFGAVLETSGWATVDKDGVFDELRSPRGAIHSRYSVLETDEAADTLWQYAAAAAEYDVDLTLDELKQLAVMHTLLRTISGDFPAQLQFNEATIEAQELARVQLHVLILDANPYEKHGVTGKEQLEICRERFRTGFALKLMTPIVAEMAGDEASNIMSHILAQAEPEMLADPLPPAVISRAVEQQGYLYEGTPRAMVGRFKQQIHERHKTATKYPPEERGGYV